MKTASTGEVLCETAAVDDDASPVWHHCCDGVRRASAGYVVVNDGDIFWDDQVRAPAVLRPHTTRDTTRTRSNSHLS